jgi:hypothetical protein
VSRDFSIAIAIAASVVLAIAVLLGIEMYLIDWCDW